VFLISGATGAGTSALMQAVMQYLEEHPREARAYEAAPVGAGAATEVV